MVGIRKHSLTCKRGINLFLFFLIAMFLSGCQDGPCPTVQEFLNNGIEKKCIICGLFEVLTQASAQAATISWNTFASALIPPVVVASAIYVAIYVLKAVGSFSKQNSADLLTGDKKGIMVLLFKTAFVVLLLKDTFLITKIIVPILNAGMEIGAVLTITGMPETPNTDAGNWTTLFNVINEYAKNVNDSSYRTVAIGQALMCNATNFGKWGIFSWEWLMLLYGVLLYLFGWMVLIAISFFIADIIVNLTFGAVLLPFAVAFYISKLTSSITRNIWNVFLHTFFSFVVLGITVGLSLQLVKLGMTEGGGSVQGEATAMASGGMALNNFLSNLDQNINEGMVKKISDGLWQSGSLILTLVSMFIVIKLLPQMKTLAGKLSNGLITEAASQGLTKATSMAVAPAQKLGSGLYKMGSNSAKNYVNRKVRNSAIGRTYRGARDTLSRWRGKLTGTGRYGADAFWR